MNGMEPPGPDRVELAGREAVFPMGSFGGRPVVDVRIDGMGPYRFVFDTGASGNAVSKSLVETLKLESAGKAKVHTGGGRDEDVDLLRARRIEVGEGAAVAGTVLAAIDLSRVFPGPADPVGVLSAGLFRGYLVTFDYPGARIVIQPGDLPPANGADVLAFDPGRRLPGIHITIADVAIEADLDSGSGRALVLPSSYAAKIPVEGPLTDAGTAKLVNREIALKRGEVRGSLRIGRWTFDRPSVLFADEAPGANVGYEILRRFAVTLDRKNGRLRLDEKNPAR